MESPAVSAAFRKQVPRVVGSIVLFMIVYLLLVAAAVALAIVCLWLGVELMVLLTNFYGLIAGLGLMAVGISVLVFLVKFTFAVAKDENSQRVAITESEQPKLFAFIRELTGQTGTKFPQKIFLVPDVNAAVFYNSSFWSMFLPIRKNLQIGLGLVNSVNVTEFKAVMAHEFGHFSQRSMKLGSFTYNVNKVIHNMLYENTGYTNFLQGWGRIHGLLGFFALVTARIAGGIQWVLRGVYTIINKSYMGLSREMEFHADAMAATVAGGNNVISSLSRVDVAASCYQTALGEANSRARENRVSRNIFANQLTVFRSFAAEHSLPLEQGVPTISFAFVTGFSRSRINFRNQWASHPTLAERKQSLDVLGIEMAADDTSAWSLFTNAEGLQQQMTAQLYKGVQFKGETRFYEGRDFEQEYLERKARYALPAAYRGFYFGRFVDAANWDLEGLAAEGAPVRGFDQLFNETTGQLQQAIENNHTDIELAMAIKEKKIDVQSFDFDGVKYDREDGEMIAQQLKKEIEVQLLQQQLLDRDAFRYFVHRPGADAGTIIAVYEEFRSVKQRYDEFVRAVNAVIEKVRPFYSGTMGLDAVTRILKELKTGEENQLKQEYRRLLENGAFGGDELRARMQKFIDADYVYFAGKQFFNNELDELRNLAIAVAGELNEYQFGVYKRMLVVQLGEIRAKV
jgi:Zn-dependent protease with chaperone function